MSPPLRIIILRRVEVVSDSPESRSDIIFIGRTEYVICLRYKLGR